MTSTSFECTQSVRTISLLAIDYKLLVEKNSSEINKFFKASTELGFFYLKIGDQLDPTPFFELAKNVFELPLDTKNTYAMDGKNGIPFGYKAAGSTYTDKKGTPDTMEFWNIPKDEILLQDGIKYPQVIFNAKDTVKEYMMKSHEIVLVILQILAEKLGLDSQVFSNLHRLMQPSGDHVRLTRCAMYPLEKQPLTNVALGAHTDFGSITILFNRLDGLQVLSPDGEWLYVKPLSGHAVVNLGDAMVKLTGGLLKSNVHRVVSIPGLNEMAYRYSVVYFSRPENDVQMKSLLNDTEEEQHDTEVLTAQEWIARQVKNIQTSNYQGEQTYAMSRVTEGHREG